MCDHLVVFNILSKHRFYPTEFNRSLPEMLCSDDDSGNQDMMDTDWTEADDESPKRNAEVILKISDITRQLLQHCY